MRLNLAMSTASNLAIGLAAISTPAFAQSTGSIDFDKEIVVTGARSTVQAVAGISAPDTAKSKAVLTSENIERQNPARPFWIRSTRFLGVSFQNNDAYGSSGGTLNIRGFSSDRVSLTFDGVPLNDSGNYAIYSNQQVDPELIEQVNVNLAPPMLTAPPPGGPAARSTTVPRSPITILGAAQLPRSASTTSIAISPRSKPATSPRAVCAPISRPARR
ncbi:MAG: TonB-dependent receptor plug domain-containing protein [Novosphingobium sp.]